jgi:CyaY protein
MSLDESDFDRLADATLKALTRALDAIGEEIDPDYASGILTVEFEAGPHHVINSHRAARQIWLAAESTAAHFTYDEVSRRWLDDRTGEELFDRVERQLSAKLGRSVSLGRPGT